MKEKLYKITKVLGIYCLILFAFSFLISLFIHYKYFSFQAYKEEVNDYKNYEANARDYLFKKYQSRINIKKYPRTFSEYLKIEKQDRLNLLKDEPVRYDWFYGEINYNTKTKKSLIEQLQHQNPTNNLIKAGFRDFGSSNEQIYYDNTGTLLFVQISLANRISEYNVGTKTYRYGFDGKLIEAEYWDGDELNIILDGSKQLKYYCAYESCSSAKEIFNFKQYILNKLYNFIFWNFLLGFISLFIFSMPLFITILIFWLIATSKMQKKEKIIYTSALLVFVLSIIWIIQHLYYF
jgi:hypothetical protein